MSLAIGLRKFLLWNIALHQRRHGVKPLAFLLHPTFVDALGNDAAAHVLLRRTEEGYLFCEIPVVAVPSLEHAAIINAAGEKETL